MLKDDLERRPESAALAIVRVDHVGIMVDDVAAASAWYVRTLGARIQDDWADEASGMSWAHLDIAGTRIELVQRPGLSPASGAERGPHHVALVVKDCDESTRALVDAGGEVVFPPSYFERHDMDWSFMRDPFGTVLELVSYRSPEADPRHP